MKHSLIKAFLYCAVVFTSAGANALNAQSDAPIRIQSDSAELNAEKNYAIYTGDVVVTQNGTTLTADKVVIYRSNGDLTKIEAYGNPAQFAQPADDKNPATHAYGKIITYSLDSETLRLEQNARFVQQSNSISGDIIEYDTQKRVAKATGNKASKERVDIIFNPAIKTANDKKTENQ